MGLIYMHLSTFIHSIQKKKDHFVFDYTGTQEMPSGKLCMGLQHDTSTPEFERFEEELFDASMYS